MADIDAPGLANLDPRCMFGRIYMGNYMYYPLIYTCTQNIKALGFVVSKKKKKFSFSYCKSMWADDP